MTRKKFEISTVSSLDVILSHRDEIFRIYESNQLATSRVRLTLSRLPTLDQKLYESFTFLRSKNVEVSSLDFVTKATEIKTKLLSNNGLNDKEKAMLENFKVTNGFVQNFKNRHNIKFKKFSGEVGSFLISRVFEI